MLDIPELDVAIRMGREDFELLIADQLEEVRRLVLLNEERDLRQIPATALSLEGVRLLTIHGSKGLEFEAVHIPGMTTTGLPSNFRPPRCPPPAGLITRATGNDTRATSAVVNQYSAKDPSRTAMDVIKRGPGETLTLSFAHRGGGCTPSAAQRSTSKSVHEQNTPVSSAMGSMNSLFTLTRASGNPCRCNRLSMRSLVEFN